MREKDPVQVNIAITQNPSLKGPEAIQVQIAYLTDWRPPLVKTREYPSIKQMVSQINREVLLRKAQMVIGLAGIILPTSIYVFRTSSNLLDTPPQAILLGTAVILCIMAGSAVILRDGIKQFATPWYIQQKIKEVVKADYTILPTL